MSRAVPLLLAGAVVLAFAPVLGNGFVLWDDDLTITENPFFRGLSATHLRWMFTTTHGGHYQPLAWVTLGLDHALWGMEPRGYHLTSLLLHAANAAWAYLLVRHLLRRGLAERTDAGLAVAAAAGALFFALHPLRVESVAWASERRDVLSGFFYLPTVLAYLRMTEARGARRAAWLGASLACFLLSLLSKAWGVTLPVVLLVLDAYPLGRVGREPASRLLLEKVPYALLAAATAAGAFLAQHPVEAMRTLAHHGVWARLAQASYGLCFYLWKTIVPWPLWPAYLLEVELQPTRPVYLAAMGAVAALTLVLVACRRRAPWALAAWVAYAVVVSPVLGFVQTGPQIAADRYTYLACLPFAVLAGAAVYAGRRVPLATGALAAALLALLGVLSARQARIWHDSHTLWAHVLRVDPGNFVGYVNRGKLEEPARAAADYGEAIRLNPRFTLAWFSRGAARHRLGDYDGAVADYTEAIRLKPGDPKAWNNRGWARQAQGDWVGAAADYAQALALAPPGWNGRALIEGNLAAAEGRLLGRGGAVP